MLSSAVLQWIAMGAMLIDHMGIFLFGNAALMRMIGRIAFPIFAFLLAEGFRHTHSFWRYFFRMFIVAVISQVPAYLAFGRYGVTSSLVVLFGFCLALLAMWGWKKGDLGVALVPITLYIACVAPIDYGLLSVLLPFLFYVIEDVTTNIKRKNIVLIRKIATSLVIFICFSIKYIASGVDGILFAIASFASIVPIFLYSGKKGRRLPKIVTYGFYPLHLFAIWVVMLALSIP